MARAAARILTSIWQDEAFVRLGARAQWLYMLLLSQPDLNHLGVLSLAVGRWASRAAGTTDADVEKALADLAEADFVVVDWAAHQLLIRTFIRHDGVYRQPNVLRAAKACIPALYSAVLAQATITELERLNLVEVSVHSLQTIEEMKAQLAVLANPSPNPSGNPSPNPSPKGSGKASPKGLGDRGSTSLEVVAEPRARARGTRIPDPFVVTPEMVAWARDRVPAVDGRLETEKFTNYWRAKTGAGATKLDWTATWRNWMLSAAERLPERRGGPVSSRSTTDDRVRQALDVGRELQARADRGELEA